MAEFQTLSTHTFGDFSRFKLTLNKDRTGETVIFVTDAETEDELGLPSVVVQLHASDGYRGMVAEAKRRALAL